MAKNKQHPQDRGGFVGSRKPSATSPALEVRNNTKPVLVITGITAASLTAIVVGMLCTDPADPVIDVERAQYATREACLDDWNNPADCQQVDDDADVDPDVNALASLDSGAASETTSTSSGGSVVHHSHVSHSGWYGPYYTRSGTIYHNNGLSTTGHVPATVHGQTSSVTMRSTWLGSGSSAYSHSPSSVSRWESAVVSRGGFTSGHGGGFGGSQGG